MGPMLLGTAVMSEEPEEMSIGVIAVSIVKTVTDMDSERPTGRTDLGSL
jgi:hypothetical protein